MERVAVGVTTGRKRVWVGGVGARRSRTEVEACGVCPYWIVSRKVGYGGEGRRRPERDEPELSSRVSIGGPPGGTEGSKGRGTTLNVATEIGTTGT